jgi:hypothetical protein
VILIIIHVILAAFILFALGYGIYLLITEVFT